MCGINITNHQCHWLFHTCESEGCFFAVCLDHSRICASENIVRSDTFYSKPIAVFRDLAENAVKSLDEIYNPRSQYARHTKKAENPVKVNRINVQL